MRNTITLLWRELKMDNIMVSSNNLEDEFPNSMDNLCTYCCTLCTACDWYCPTPCPDIDFMRRIPYNKLKQKFIKSNGDFYAVFKYVHRKRLREEKNNYISKEKERPIDVK